MNHKKSQTHITHLDRALQKMAVDEDVPLASISDDLQLPPGVYLPDSLERREASQTSQAVLCEQEDKTAHNGKSKKKAVEVRLGKFMVLLKNAQFSTSFLTNMEVLSRHMIDKIWERLSQHMRHDDVYKYFVNEVRTGQLVVYVCKKASEVLGERHEYSNMSTELINRIDEIASVSAFETIDSYHSRLSGEVIMSLAQWMPRSISGLSSAGSGGGSSSGCSSPNSSFGGSSSGVGVALTPRVHSKNPLITRLLPWTLIKGFAQSDAVTALFESYAATDEALHSGKEMYIFADCTVIALARSLLMNSHFMQNACIPNSPTKRRRDGVETHPESATDDLMLLKKALTDYIQFIHDHANDMHTDDSVSITTLIERHMQHLLPHACQYLREHEFVGF